MLKVVIEYFKKKKKIPIPNPNNCFPFLGWQGGKKFLIITKPWLGFGQVNIFKFQNILLP